jgi:hypothetical protein
MLNDEDERRADETQDDDAEAEEPRSDQATSEASEARDEDAEKDPKVAEIEQDPARNPENPLLRDIKGG